MADIRNITIKICGKDFALAIPAQEEEIYRRAAKELSTTVAAYQAKLKTQQEDFIILAALHIAVSKVRIEMDKNKEKNTQALEQINKNLSEYLSSVKAK